MPTPLTAESLAGFPGAPFNQGVLDSALAALQHEAGWHIAPAVTETLTLDSVGGAVLVLPTLNLTSVTEVRDLSGPEPRVITGWRKSVAGLLYLPRGWPCGFATVEVDLTHGYEELPVELLPVLASQCRASARDDAVSAESAGPFSVTYRAATPAGYGSPALRRYTLPGRP